MTKDEAVAYLNAQSTCALIEMNGMIAENISRQDQGKSLAYSEKEFNDLILRYGISHNQVIEFFRRFE